ncbi:MAG: hypothetical protein GXO06_01265 [Epsilonproteobacteria bacterium]|nr:hypothetical protein [Campylobacterota bacterium]
MRYLLIILLSIPLISGNLSKLYKLYEKQEYESGCRLAKRLYRNYLKSESFQTLYGLNCLETDRIDEIAKPMVLLKKSKESRQNASYFGTILLQKQLLRQAIVDKRELGELKLPKTNFFISKIFNLFVEHKYSEDNGRYRMEDGDREYQLYIDSRDRMVVDIYKDRKFLKRYIYN